MLEQRAEACAWSANLFILINAFFVVEGGETLVRAHSPFTKQSPPPPLSLLLLRLSPVLSLLTPGASAPSLLTLVCLANRKPA